MTTLAIGMVEYKPSDYKGKWAPRYDLHMDIRKLAGVQIVSAWQKAKLDPESLDKVFSSQTFEHLRKAEQVEALNRTYTWLKPEGLLELWTPDLQRQVALVTEGSITWEWFQTICYGEQDYEANTHMWCHTRASLNAMVSAAGFIVLSCQELNGSIVLMAQKPKAA